MTATALFIAAQLTAAITGPADTSASTTPYICSTSSTASFWKKTDLPVAVQNAITFPMADSGEPYNSSDVIQIGLPGRRFISARLENCRFEILYEMGGIGVSRRKLIVNSIGGQWIAIQDNSISPISGD